MNGPASTSTNFGTTPPAPGSDDVQAYVQDSDPDINLLQEEYQFAWNQDPDAAGRIARSEDIRYTRWPGQSADGLKHQELMPEGQRALPYNRAPDTRINLCDSIIQGQVDVDWAAFWNARAQVAPVAASRLSLAQSGEWRQILSWMIHGPLKQSLIDNVEFVSQVVNTIGWCVLHPLWRRKSVMRLVTVTFDNILELSDKAPSDSLLQAAPAFIKDPTQEDAGVQFLQLLFPNLSTGRARKVLRELRDNDEAEFPVPDQVQNMPELAVLVPWQDFIMPIEATANPEMARAMFRRMFFTTPSLEERAAEEYWNREFVDAVLKTKGQAMENGTSVEHDADENQQLIEISYAYQRKVDEDGVPGIYCTVFSPFTQANIGAAAKSQYGQHWLLDAPHGEYPFIFLNTEVTGRRPSDARGVPDVLQTAQNEMKQQRDATYVFSQLSTTPPLIKKGTQASKIPPQLGPLGIINEGSGEWDWFAPPKGEPQIAFKLIEDVRKESQDYYGVPRADTLPMLYQPRQQRRVTRNLAKWGQALWQLSVLTYHNMSPEEMQGILGRQPLLKVVDIVRHRLNLWYDVRSMDPAWVESLIKSIAEFVLPVDAAGVVDRSKLVQMALSYLDPTLAEEVTTDMAGAKQAMFKEVRDEIGQVMQGNEALYTENDPAAKAKLLFAQQIIRANPDYMQQLAEQSPAFNSRKRENLDKYIKNLQQSAMQQDNKTIGRLGVRPGPGVTQGTQA